jgi:hypothetical protein
MASTTPRQRNACPHCGNKTQRLVQDNGKPRLVQDNGKPLVQGPLAPKDWSIEPTKPDNDQLDPYEQDC